jgi:hypothetical protein
MNDRAVSPDDGEELEIDVRPAEALAGRLIVLAAVCRRAFLEHGVDIPIGDDDDEDEDEDNRPDDPETQRYDLAAWVREERLDVHAAPFELDFIDAPLGTVGEDDAAIASWEGESLVAVAWVAGLIPDMPGYSGPADLAEPLALIPDAWDKTGPFAASLEPRDDEAVAIERERAELWYWRAGIEALARESSRSEAAHLRKIAAETAAEARAAGLLDQLAKRDFSLGGQPIPRLDDDALDTLASLSERRLRALNWCCGFGDSWSDVPLDLD